MELLTVKNEKKKYDEFVVTVKVGNEETGKMEPVWKLVRSEPTKVKVEADFTPLVKKLVNLFSTVKFDNWYLMKFTEYLGDGKIPDEEILKDLAKMLDL